MFDNPWLVNFAIKVVNSVLNLPDRQVKFFGILNYRRPAINPAHYFFSGLIHASDKCSNEVMKHDNLVEHYMILLYDIIINSLCVIQSNDNSFFYGFLHVFLFWYCLGYNSILLSHTSRLYQEQPNSEGFR